ncbi:hypothetical protein L208DRAFT_640558 [Tricholoma matsutake]|nr:hypothetical protein L208DRAFT_640558 [Tricholoma matsutake 945]
MSFESSPETANTSRSPSPVTPEPSDSLESVAVRGDFDHLNSWYLPTMHQLKSTDSQSLWDIDSTDLIPPTKTEDHQMLHLDDLIEQHAYEEYVFHVPSISEPLTSSFNSSTSLSLPSSLAYSSQHLPLQLIDSIRSADFVNNFIPNLVPPSNAPISATKPIPPPASLPRKQGPSSINQRVVCPPKESCFNLPIMFPSIPEGGTKSRVETQVRVTVDLADASSSSDPHKYDRIGSWKWLKLPQGTATKRRTRKQGRIDPDPQDILHLSATDLKLNTSAKKRAKPYDSAGKPNRASREGSVVSIPSPSSTFSSLPMTRSPTPSALFQHFLTESTPLQHPPQLQHSSHASDSSSTDTLMTPLDRSPNISTEDGHRQHEIIHAPSPLSLPTTASSVVMPTHPHPMPFMFFDSHPPSDNVPPQLPIIHRLIPNMGPTHGGIEVTVLGSNFHPSLQLNCVFGDVSASSTQRWSDNTLVCVLPPRATAGVVAVWFDGLPKVEDQTNAPPCLFTYADESDRALYVFRFVYLLALNHIFFQ